MNRIEMYFAWFVGFLVGLFLLVIMSISDFFINLFELPFDTWNIVKEKYEEI